MDHDTIDHREYEDMLAAAALGALSTDEHRRLRRHLRSCASCRETYSRLVVAVDMLPLAVAEREPSAALRERLAAQVGAKAASHPAAPTPPPGEPDIVPLVVPVPEPPAPAPRRVPAAWLAIAAAMLLIGLVAGALVGRYLLVDDGQRTEQIAMESPAGLDLAGATLTWFPDDGVLKFSAPDLAAPPAGEVYQVWLIASADQPPTPVGTVDGAGQFATTVERDQFGTFAVTVEPGPLGSPGPTTDPVIVAQIGQSG